MTDRKNNDFVVMVTHSTYSLLDYRKAYDLFYDVSKREVSVSLNKLSDPTYCSARFIAVSPL